MNTLSGGVRFPTGPGGGAFLGYSLPEPCHLLAACLGEGPLGEDGNCLAQAWGFTFYTVHSVSLFDLDSSLGRQAQRALSSLLHRGGKGSSHRRVAGGRDRACGDHSVPVDLLESLTQIPCLGKLLLPSRSFLLPRTWFKQVQLWLRFRSKVAPHYAGPACDRMATEGS